MLISFIPASGNAKHMDSPDSMSGECCSKSCLFKVIGSRRKSHFRPGGGGGSKSNKRPEQESSIHPPPKRSSTFLKIL